MLPKMLRKMLRKISVVSLFLLASVFSFAQAKSRHFELDYSFTVRITDPGKRSTCGSPSPSPTSSSR